MPRPLYRLFALLLLPAWLTGVHAEPGTERVVLYARHQANDPNTPYMLALLALAKSKAGLKLNIQPSKSSMNQGRATLELREHTGQVHLLWAMTSQQREKELLPVRIPLDKGLMGWRIPLVRKSQAALFEAREKADIAKLSAGQMADWPDTEILRANHFAVSVTAQYENLFAMLSHGRIDYFPRSISEVWQELADHSAMGIVIETSSVIHYPTAFYFFVGPLDTELAAGIERGLEIAIRDGSFEQTFLAFNREAIERAGLAQRRVIRLDNPLLPKETPIKRSELWFRPQ